MEEIYILQTSIDDAGKAEHLAREAVEAGLAACAQVSGRGLSFFSWGGKVERAEENYLCLKTTDGKLPQAIAWLRTHHPYEVPEILWWRCEADAAYAAWARRVLADGQD
jgi:Uncharacterized protein involved in tolerance to divalent cations